ncbi:MAG: MATE family efflux transporter [Candidatus Krumholzibacteriota bacterium]|nr:MATE family efflux transporter [Candidatus Krumholzibacteriota bacterium]
MNREIIRLSSPVIVGMISTTILNIVDTAMVGRLGDAPLAAVGLGSFITLVAVLIFGSLHVGTQAIVSRRLGEGRTGEYARILANTFFLASIVGIVVSALGYRFSGGIFSLLSDRPEIAADGVPYLRIRMAGVFAVIVMYTLRGYAFGLARVRIDMIVSLIVNVLNILLNWFLIFGHWTFPRLETRGAAIASVISTAAGLVVYLLFIEFRIIRRLPRAERRSGLDARMMALIIRISAPRAVQSLSTVGFVVFLGLVGRIGIAELAISNIIFKAFNVTFMIGMAIGTAAATLVGRSLGEKDPDKAARYGWRSALLGASLMGAIGACFMFFPRQIMGVFTREPATVELGVVPFRLLGAFQFIDGFGIVLSRVLQGAGSTMYVMISEIICVWGILIPYSNFAVAALGGGLVAAWWGVYLYFSIFACLMAWKFREGGWRHIRI